MSEISSPVEKESGAHSRRGVSPRTVVASTAVLAGTCGASLLTDGVTRGGDLAVFDPAVTADFVAARSEFLTVVAQAFTFLGSTTSLVPLTLGLLTVLCVRRRWHAAGVVALGMSLSLALTVLFKHAVGRVRPPSIDMLGPIEKGFAFPSGHTLNGTVFFGLVTGLLLTRCVSRWARTAAVVGGCVMALGIGLSRVYLGFHWLTDVMAGWSIAAAILGVVVLSAVMVSKVRSR